MKMEQLQKFIQPLMRSVRQTVARAVLKVISDDRGLQRLQVQLLADELHSQVPRIQEYGYTSVPLPGAEGIFLAVGGAREHGVIVATDDARYRPKNLEPGEVCIYTDEGDKIYLKRNNIIRIESNNEIQLVASAKVSVEAPSVTVDCDTAEVNAAVSVEVTTLQATVNAATQIDAVTPLLNVSGLIACSGIATGGLTPEANKGKFAGDVTVDGNIEATGDVSDAAGSMQEMRDTFNGHVHSNPEGGNVGPATPQMT